LADCVQGNPHTPDSSILLQELLHFAFPAFRVLLLTLLLAALSSPRIVYTSVGTEDNNILQATDSTFLLPSDPSRRLSNTSSPIVFPKANKYGTFRGPRFSLHSSAPATRATTPTPSIGTDKVGLSSRPLIL